VETITTFKYDNHPNPWNLLFKEAGVLLPIPGIEQENISKNNPVESSVLAIFTGAPMDTVEVSASVTYEYNSGGYPTQAIATGGNPDTSYFRYQ